MTPSGLICPPRFGTPRNPDRETLGPKVGELARKLGLPFMPWQQHVVDVAYEIDPATGQLVYREVNLTVPRQEGKTALAFVVKVFRCTRFGGKQTVVYTAQTRNAAMKKFLDEHVFTLDHTAAFKSPRDYTVRKSNGSEAIMWRNGSKWSIDAPTRSAGHGDSLDHGDIDEAFAHQDDRVEVAMGPTMITRPSPQLWVYSTAGDAQSFYWYRKILAGRQASERGGESPVAYFEWSAPDEADPADEETWRSCSPALGHTISLESLRAEWGKAQRKGVEGVDAFRRSFLNQWPEVPQLDDQPGLWQVIDRESWMACVDRESRRGEALTFCIDTSLDRQWSSIGMASTRPDGIDHVEVVDHRPGNAWVVDRLRDLVDRWHPVAVVIDPGGPAGSLLDDVVRAVGEDLVVKPTAREHAQAAGNLADAVTHGRVVHLGQSELDNALACAAKRPLGDAWAWNRAGVSPVSPLVAVTLARWALRHGAVQARPYEGPMFAFS